MKPMSDLRRLLGFESLKDPLITLIDYAKVKMENDFNVGKIPNELPNNIDKHIKNVFVSNIELY